MAKESLWGRLSNTNFERKGYLFVLADDSSDNSSWEGDERPDEQNDDDGPKGQRSGGTVEDGHRVQEGEGDEHGPAEQRAGQDDITHLHETSPRFGPRGWWNSPSINWAAQI